METESAVSINERKEGGEDREAKEGEGEEEGVMVLGKLKGKKGSEGGGKKEAGERR